MGRLSHRKRWGFPSASTGAQKDAGAAWLAVIQPFIGSFTANMEMVEADLSIEVRGDAGGHGLVLITPNGKVKRRDGKLVPL